MQALNAFQRLQKIPGGTKLFSFFVCQRAPFFSSIHPHVEEVRSGYVRISVKKRRRVENHIGTVHAIAMCNMAELAGGLMTDVSLPEGARWIPSGMTVKYLKKATTDLTAVAEGDAINWNVSGDIVVPVKIYDMNDTLVFTADITMNVKQKEKGKH